MATTNTLAISDEPVRARLDGLQKHVHLSWGDTSIKLSIEEAVDVIDGITSVFAQLEELRQKNADYIARRCSATDVIDDPDCRVHSAADHRVARAQYLTTLFEGSGQQ